MGIFREIINAFNRRDKRRLVESLGVSGIPDREHEPHDELVQGAHRSALESLTNDGIPTDSSGIEAADLDSDAPSSSRGQRQADFDRERKRRLSLRLRRRSDS